MISFPKNKSLQINYWIYKHLNEYSFDEDLKLAFTDTDIPICEKFDKKIKNLLGHHASLKKKILRGENAPYVTKKLRKSIVKNLRLKKVRWKTLTKKCLKAYKKQKNYMRRLHKKERKMFFDSLNPSISY